jgi:hypothetical protein
MLYILMRNQYLSLIKYLKLSGRWTEDEVSSCIILTESKQRNISSDRKYLYITATNSLYLIMSKELIVHFF